MGHLSYYPNKNFRSRDYPAPVYPPESHEKLSKNYYFSRDARSEIRPPIELAGADVAKQLDDGTEKPAKPKNWPPIPGKPGNWDSHNFIKKY